MVAPLPIRSAGMLTQAQQMPTMTRQTAIGAGEIAGDLRHSQAGQPLKSAAPLAQQEVAITAQDLAAAPVVTNEGAVGKTLGFVDGISSRFFQGDMMLFMGSAVIGLVLSPVTLVGKIIGNDNVATFAARMSRWIAAPREEIMHTSLSEGASALAERSSKLVGGRFGEQHVAARGLAQAAQGLGRAEAAMGRGMQVVFNGAASSVGSVAQNSGVRGWMLNRAALRAAEQRGGLGMMVAKFENVLNAHAGDIGHALAHDGMPIREPVGRAFRAAGAPEIAMTAAQHLNVLQAGLKTLKDAAAGVGGITAEMTRDAMRSMNGAADALSTIHKKTEGMAAKRGLSAVSKELGLLEKVAANAGRALCREQTLTNIPAALREMPQRLGKASMFNAAMNTAITVGTVAQGYNAAMTIGAQWGALRQMCADLEGKKSVSTMHVLMGDVPPLVAAVRNQLLLKEALPKLGLEGLSAALNVQMLRGKLNHMLALPMFMAPALASMFLVQDTEVLKNYAMLKRAQDAKIPIHPSAYASLIISASPEIAKNLEAQKDANGLMAALSKEYADAKMAPQEVLKEIGNGKLNERATRLQAEMEAKGRKPGELSPEAKAEMEAAKANDNAAQMQQPGIANNGKQIVGRHTAQLANKAQAAAAQPTMPVIKGMTPNPVVSGPQQVEAVRMPGVAMPGVA